MAVILTAFFVVRFQPFLVSRFDIADNSYETFSLSERQGMNELAVQMIIAHPLTGVGAANYSTAVRAMVGYPLDWAHNVPLLIGSELGGPGLLLFALMIGSLLVAGRQRWRARSISLWQALIGGALIGLSTIMMFDHYLWTAPQGTLLWAWLAGWWMRE
jgi:O-antigen ligase